MLSEAIILFWIVALLLLALCVVFVATALRAGADDARPDVAVYRDQLAELTRDRERGTLTEEEAEAARTEVARRLLTADSAGGAVSRGPGNPLLGLALVALPVIGISLWTYLSIGAPGYPDLPLQARIALIEEGRADRPDQATAEAGVPDGIDASRPDVTEMSEQLKQVLLTRPDDLRGWQLAVRTQSGLGDVEAAWRSQNRVLAILGDAATGADFATLAELMIVAAGGYVSPQAETALSEAVRRDEDNGSARYYAGLMYAQGGRPDRAFSIWRSLLTESGPDDPWIAPIHAQIERISILAGDPTTLEELPRPRGPSEADVALSEDMTPQERIAMIGGMVQGLSERLATEGGTAGDWARLITSYGVLGRQRRGGCRLSGSEDGLRRRPLRPRRAGARRRPGRDHAVICETAEAFAAALPRVGALAGLDLGTKTCGVAVSDTLRSVSTPLVTIRRTKFTADAVALEAILDARAIVGIVLGLPLNMDGSEGPRAQATRAFARNLSRRIDTPIAYWDERLSTVAAERALLEADTSRKRRAEVIDHVAAGYILQGALDRLRHLSAVP